MSRPSLYASDAELKDYILSGVRLYQKKHINSYEFERGIEALRRKYNKDRIDKLLLELVFKLGDTRPITQDNYKLQELYTQQFPGGYYTQQEQQQKLEILELIRLFEEQLKKETLTKNLPINPYTVETNPDRQLSEPNAPIGEQHTMRGQDYVRKYPMGRSEYTHMRRMLQEIWKGGSGGQSPTMPSSQFDIDLRYQYNPYDLAMYLYSNYDNPTLDDAHIAARNSYTRGRPPGARAHKTLAKLEDSRDNKHILPNIDDLEEMPSETPEETKTDVKTFPMPDLSQFVTYPRLDAREYVSKNTMGNALANGLDACTNMLRNELRDAIAKIELQRPTVVELKRGNLSPLELGVQHRAFPNLLRMAAAALRSGAHLNVWLHGPAGTGKTTAAENVAKALFPDRADAYHYNGAIATSFQLQGFINANGNFVSTAFRQAWENGGVYMFDEIDGSMPDALLALNGALANGLASFPDKMVPRHPDCIIIAGANTCGLGGTVQYVGRFKQDFALTNRFVFLHWPLDEALEDALVANKDWLARVRHVRAKLEKGNINIQGYTITPRASIYGEALLAAGLDQETVEHATLKQGLSDAQWAMIR